MAVHRPQRIEALVDGIFAVSMTLLVLDIRLPEAARFATNADLVVHLSAIASALGTYALSFIVLAMYWAAHSDQFRYVEQIDGGLFWLNIGFLLLTTTVPFTTNLVSTHPELSLPVTIYAGNLLLLTVVLMLHAHRLRSTPGLAKSAFSQVYAAASVGRRLLVCAVPVAAMVVAQFSPEWGMRLIILLAVIHFIPRGGARGEANSPLP